VRTTVTIDPDVAERLHTYAHRNGLSFKKALNELLRRGLQAQAVTQRERFQVEPHQGRFQPGIDLGRLNQLLDQLDTVDFIRETRDGS